jgi:DMSO/TMAO reductase YedYZ molybdopterin-dependent catalytic subunit
MAPLSGAENDEKSDATYTLTVSGRVTPPLTLRMEDLRRMDMVETDRLMMICGEGDVKGVLGKCRGVLLTDIINLTEVIAPEHNDTKKTYVVPIAEDGYKTVFAWQELYNTSTGEGVIVVLEKNGRPLYDNYGAADLISSLDILSGPRYVKNVRHVDIRILD